METRTFHDGTLDVTLYKAPGAGRILYILEPEPGPFPLAGAESI